MYKVQNINIIGYNIQWRRMVDSCEHEKYLL